MYYAIFEVFLIYFQNLHKNLIFFVSKFFSQFTEGNNIIKILQVAF